MRTLLLCLALPLQMLVTSPAAPQETKSAPAAPPAAPTDAAPSKDVAKPELLIVPKRAGKDPADYTYRLGETVTIRAAEPIATKIRAEFAKGAGARSIVAQLDGVRMPNLPVSLSESRSGGELQLLIQLARDSTNDDNRKAWDAMLKKQNSYTFAPAFALAVGNDLPVTVTSMQPFQFYVVRKGEIYGVGFVGILAFVALYAWLIYNKSALRDEKGGSYSLGKSQLAFWGLVVLLSFAGVLYLTASLERIPPQVLILLGISGATGLSAMLIGDTKRKTLEKEKAQLEKDRDANPGAFTETQKTRLAELATLLAATPAQPKPDGFIQFWKDICSDTEGLSFHRLQVVLWTLVLGANFVWSVADAISMPEFSETLLLLLGVSNGTYLGFKIPEKA